MATNSESGEWAEDLVKRVGAAAKQLRGKRSARWLSERTAELGYPLSPQVIARLDSGKRNGHLELAELLVLAEALDVPAVQLIYPNIPEGDCEFLPGQHSIAWQALRRFTGETAVPGQPAMTDEREYHLSLMRELDVIPGRVEQNEASLSKTRLELAKAQSELSKFPPASPGRVLAPSEDMNREMALDAVTHLERMIQIFSDNIETWKQRDRWIRKTLQDAGFEVSVPGEDS